MTAAHRLEPINSRLRLRSGACRVRDRIVAAVIWVRRVMPRPLWWLTAHPQRVLTLAWLVGVLLVGTARTASADIIVSPDLAQGAPKTLYETYDYSDYKLTVKPDEENSDWFGISEAVLEVVGFINNLLLWACLGILYGALSLLEWLLNLTLYRDSAPQIDTATQVMASQIFWPLITATVAVGAFITYARWRGEGRGFLSDFGWVVAAGALAVGFASGPSQLMDSVDSVRQDLATGVMSGTANFTDTEGNVTGFPTPQISGDAQKAATRRLVDGMWNTFGATPWCFAQFRSLEVCEVAGYHALAGDEQWRQWMAVLDNGGAPPEFGEHVHWIRGQDITRTGYLLVLALITIPMGLILLRLVIAGLIASAGFLLMLVIGLLFLAFWPIPGWFRHTGTRYWVYTLGLQAQALFITVVVSGTTVVSVIISSQTGKYGFFIVALIDLGLFAAAMRARAWFEVLTTMGGAGSMGIVAALLMRSAARTTTRTAATVASGGLGAARAGLGGLLSPLRRGSGATPGFKDAGNWRDSRFSAGKTAALDVVAPVQATATRVPTPASVRTPLALSPAPQRTAEPDTPTPPGRTAFVYEARKPGFPNRRFLDRKLHENVLQAQEDLGIVRGSRVWVYKKGSGISPLDPITPQERSSGYRIRWHSPPRRE
jgi:hypothetical protein